MQLKMPRLTKSQESPNPICKNCPAHIISERKNRGEIDACIILCEEKEITDSFHPRCPVKRIMDKIDQKINEARKETAKDNLYYSYILHGFEQLKRDVLAG